MHIAILGAGAIGTLFAHRLALAGHTVSVVARGERLRALAAGELVANGKERSRVTAVEQLDPGATYDLVLVTVRSQQLPSVLPALAASQARRLLFLCNGVGPLGPLEQQLGRERCVWGFPAATARLGSEGALTYSIVPGWLRFMQITTLGGVGAAELAPVLRGAGFPVALTADMESWLRSHAAFMAPLMAAALLSGKGRAYTWAVCRAMGEAFARVRAAGSRVTPFNITLLGWTPKFLLAPWVWLFFKLGAVRRALSGPGTEAEASDLLQQLIELRPGVPAPHLSHLLTELAR